MHYVKAKGILHSGNTVNIYRGCSHGCIYCDSRSTCYRFQHDFTDIEVKENAIELLELALCRKRNKIMINTGSMCDPYLHIEEKLKLTNKMLEVIDKYQHGVVLLTKSDLILRDLNLLKQINKHSKVIVEFTLTTSDDQLCKIIEPNVSPYSKRLAAIKILRENGIEIGVWLTPVLPFITDNHDNIMKIINDCASLKVKYIICFSIGVTLRDGSRDYYYEMLDRHFPDLKEKYIRIYENQYEVTSLNHFKLYSEFLRKCTQNNIMTNISNIFNYRKLYEQQK